MAAGVLRSASRLGGGCLGGFDDRRDANQADMSPHGQGLQRHRDCARPADLDDAIDAAAIGQFACLLDRRSRDNLLSKGRRVVLDLDNNNHFRLRCQTYVRTLAANIPDHMRAAGLFRRLLQRAHRGVHLHL